MKTSDEIDRFKAGVTARLDDDARTIAALRAERDQARSDLAAERAAVAGLRRELELADNRLLAARRALEVARKALEEAVALLERAVKYADEDKMITPGATRLQRCLDAAESRLPALRSMAGEKEGAA